MSSLVFAMFTGIFYILLFYGVIIAIIVKIIKSSSKKKNTTTDSMENSQKGVTKTPASTHKPAPKKNPYGMLNILLYFGSFLIVCAMYYFAVNTNEALVAPITIVLTLVLYCGGLCLYKMVDYLKSVGMAFCYTSLAIIPFWVISLSDFNLSLKAVWAITSIVAIILYSIAAIVMNARAIPFFVYLWFIALALALNPFEGDLIAANGVMYWTTIAPLVVSFIPTSLWLMKPFWLPVVFRQATMMLGKALLPVIYCLTLPLFFTLDAGTTFPFLRTILAIILAVFMLVHYVKNHSYTAFIFSRFAAQLMIFSVAADATNFSFFADTNESSLIVVSLVWLLSFLVQAITAIAIPKRTEAGEKSERVVEIISLVGIFLTILMVLDLSESGKLTMELAVFSVVAILGVVYSVYHKKCAWGIATIISLALMPAALGRSDAVEWNSWCNFFYFVIFGILILAAFYFADKESLKDSFPVSATGIGVVCLALLPSAEGADCIEMGWLLVAGLTAGLGYLSKIKWVYEVSIYSAALCAFSLVGTIGNALDEVSGTVSSYCANSYMRRNMNCVDMSGSATMAASLVRAYIMPAALFATAKLKEGGKKMTRRGRFIIGYALLSLGLLFVGADGGESWMLASLFTQIAFLIYSVLKDEDWLVWTSIVLLVISMATLTKGLNYIWFGVSGLILILIVIWRLTKIHRAEKNNGNQIPAENKTQSNNKK